MTTEKCCHYWLLDAKSFGICKYCGTTKQFVAGEEVLSAWSKAEDEPFSQDDIMKAKAAGVELKTNHGRRTMRHNPNGKLKQQKCPYCPEHFDPRGLHIHIAQKHPFEEKAGQAPTKEPDAVTADELHSPPTLPLELDVLLAAVSSNYHSWGEKRRMAWCRVLYWTMTGLGLMNQKN